MKFFLTASPLLVATVLVGPSLTAAAIDVRGHGGTRRELRMGKSKSSGGKTGKSKSSGGKTGKSTSGLSFDGFTDTGSVAFQAVLGLYLEGIEENICLGPDFSRGERQSCFGIGGFIIESMAQSNGVLSDTGYCCPSFDTSTLVEDGCFLNPDPIGGDSCQELNFAMTGQRTGGFRIFTQTFPTAIEYCCPSSIITAAP